MTDTERVWLVYREYTDKGLLNVVYATPDGERVLRKQRSMNAGDPTAAVDADADDLEPPRTTRSATATPTRRRGCATATTPTTACRVRSGGDREQSTSGRHETTRMYDALPAEVTGA